MNFSDYRTLTTRMRPVQEGQDEYHDNKEESVAWIRKYLDLADLLLESDIEEERRFLKKAA